MVHVTQLLMVGVFWFASVTGGQVEVQKMGNFPLGTWEKGDQLLWKETKVGDQMELVTKVEKDGKYRLQVVLTKGPDFGTVQFELDGKKVGGKLDLFSEWVTNTPPIPLGDHQLTAGEHKLTVTIVGKCEESKGTVFGIDQVLLTPCKKLGQVNEFSSVDPLVEPGNLEALPKLRPGERSIMFSSYDRTGGNNDGFAGTYSKLWIEDDNSVLAVMDGPGVVERIWFTHSTGKPGLLGCKGEHIRIYLDGNEKPAVDVPIADLFSGKLPQFPAPLVGENQGGFYCYVPIPYRDGCKIEVDGRFVRFYQITYTKLPAKDVNRCDSFSMESLAQEEVLKLVVKIWSNLGDPAALYMEEAKWIDVDLNLKPGEERKIDLPAGPGMVRAVMLDGDQKQLDAAREATMQFCWDDAKESAIDLTAEFFFCQAMAKKKVRTLLTGATDQGWYNFMPMPYRESGTLVVRAKDKPVSGKLRIATIPIDASEDLSTLGYLHAAYNESLPAKPNVHHPFLKRKGTGHYIGTYMTTRGSFKNPIPVWLEGDEVFTVDGSLDIHGTGSEDYFNCGWYALKGRLNGPGGAPSHGFPVYRREGEGDKVESLATAYRWHVADPVPFEKEIEAKIEHGPGNKTKADYRSSAFYYEVMP